MVAMAAETAWVHQHPQRLMRVCRTGRARLIILAAVFVAVAVNCPNFWTFSLYTSPSSINYDPTSSLIEEQMLEEKAGVNTVPSDPERPTCANEITDERLVVAAASSWTGNQQDVSLDVGFNEKNEIIRMKLKYLLSSTRAWITERCCWCQWIFCWLTCFRILPSSPVQSCWLPKDWEERIRFGPF